MKRFCEWHNKQL